MKLSYVSLAILLAAAVGLGCTKKGGDKKKESGGDESSDDTGADDSPPDPACLALESDTGVTDDDTDGTDDTTVEDDATTDGAEDDDAQKPIAENGVGTAAESGCPTGDDDGGGTPTGGGGTSWNEGDTTLAECNEKGDTWIAVVNKGPAQCSASKLVDWCCTRAEGLKRFPGLKDALNKEFDRIEALGYKLYGCSKDQGVTFHFAGLNDKGLPAYQKIWTNSAAAAGNPKGAECKDVTIADLGLDKFGAGGDDDEDDEADDEEPAEDEIPKVIGELKNADDKNKIRDWLKTAPNISTGDWKRSAPTNGPHFGATNVNKARASYNKKMREGFKDADAAKELPVGSLAIKTLYDDTDVLGYVIMGKAKTGEGEGTWLFFEVKGDAVDAWKDATPSVHTLGDNATADGCTNCHKGTKDRDFMKGTVPAL